MHLESVMIFVALNVIEWKGKCIFEPVYRVGRLYEKIETHFSLWFESIKCE